MNSPSKSTLSNYTTKIFCVWVLWYTFTCRIFWRCTYSNKHTHLLMSYTFIIEYNCRSLSMTIVDFLYPLLLFILFLLPSTQPYFPLSFNESLQPSHSIISILFDLCFLRTSSYMWSCCYIYFNGYRTLVANAPFNNKYGWEGNHIDTSMWWYESESMMIVMMLNYSANEINNMLFCYTTWDVGFHSSCVHSCAM